MIGGAGNDRLFGGQGDDFVIGGAGADILEGGDGIDTLSYQGATVGVTVAFEGTSGGSVVLNTTGSGGDAQGDLISGFENLIGGNGNDTLTGNEFDNIIAGGAGADTFVGGDGIDTLDYSASNSGVTIALGHGAGLALDGNIVAANSGGHATGDSVSGFENIIGSKYNDNLGGNGLENVIDGGLGNDTIEGGAGWDTLIGGAGIDTVSYEHGTTGVSIALANDGSFTSAVYPALPVSEVDTGTGFENITGSSFEDILTGNRPCQHPPRRRRQRRLVRRRRQRPAGRRRGR